MKILILAYEIGLTSSGISTKRIAKELINNGHEVKILTSNIDEELKKNIIKCSSFPTRPARLFIWIGNLIKWDISYWAFEINCRSKVKKLILHWSPDIVYARSSPLSPFLVANWMKKRYGSRIILHFADPIPAPVSWESNLLVRKKKINTLKDVLINADLISFENSKKFILEQSYFPFDLKNRSFITPDPISTKQINIYPINKGSIIRYVFLGTFYGNRKPISLFEAFTKLYNIKRNVELIIYDSPNSYYNNTIFSPLIGSVIKFVGRTSRVINALSRADILIDIDSCDVNEVYMSNKLKDYIGINRLCVYITSIGSPSHELLKPLTTFIYANNDVEDIFTQLRRTFMLCRNVDLDFSERNLIFNSYNVNTITNLLINRINAILQ